MNLLRDPWPWRMAWRDLAGGGRAWWVSTLALAVGVASLVSIRAFRVALQDSLQAESKAILGADLKIEGRAPYPEAIEDLLRQEIVEPFAAEASDRVSFQSMAVFERSGDTRLVQVRAVEGGYPFYGDLLTEPAAAAGSYRDGLHALVEDGLMRQYQVQVGDPLRIGGVVYRVAGSLRHVPGESAARAMFGPRVFVPRAGLDESLLARGSRVNYDRYYRLPPQADVDRIVRRIQDDLSAANMGQDTVEEQQENWGSAARDLQGFLSLVGFVSLILGGLAVASSFHAVVARRRRSIALLRCLGATSGRVVAMFAVQVLALGVAGALAGSLLGWGVRWWIPRLVAGFVPVDAAVGVPWGSLGWGMGVGVAGALLFGLRPLLDVRQVPPGALLRVVEAGPRRSLAGLWPLGLVAGAVGLFAVQETGEWDVGFGYAGGVLAALGVLAGAAWCLMRGARRIAGRSLPYVLVQALANLFRPRNQTLLVVVSLGTGVFLLLVLFGTRSSLLARFAVEGTQELPDLVLYDVQDRQRDEVRRLVQEGGAVLAEEAPLVNMRLASLKGRPVEDWREGRVEGQPRPSRWALRREYRSTYRGALADTETLLRGEFVGSVPPDAEVFPVSVEERQAERLGLGLGDRLAFDIHGVSIPAVIASVRRVEWRRARPNFFFVFPEGCLEQAPQFHVLLVRTSSPDQSADLQRAILEEHPNVSCLDVTLILRLVDQLMGRITQALGFMAAFTVVTGVLVLLGATLAGRAQRVRESVLLRTLGAQRRQVQAILLGEILLLSAVAAVVGGGLAHGGTWLLCRLVFDVPVQVGVLPYAASFLGLLALTTAVTLASARGVTRTPPLEVLRAENRAG